MSLNKKSRPTKEGGYEICAVLLTYFDSLDRKLISHGNGEVAYVAVYDIFRGNVKILKLITYARAKHRFSF